MEMLMKVTLFTFILALVIAVTVFAFLHPNRGIGEDGGYQVPLILAPLWILAVLFVLVVKDRKPP